MTLRVAFHRTPALRPKTGVGHYTAELLRELELLKPQLEVVGLPAGVMASVYRAAAHPLLGRAESAPPNPDATPKPSSSALRRILRGGYQSAHNVFFRALSRKLTKSRFDLYHEPNFPILPTELPTVLTIYDLSLILMPEFHPADRVALFEKQFAQAREQATHIVTISDFIRDEIIRVLGVPPERVTRTYLGVRPDLTPLPKPRVEERLRALNLPATYLLYVGTLEPRKNLLRLMQAYCRLEAPLREKCPLLLVGGWGWNIGEMADFLESEGRRKGVIHVGYVSDADLATLYNGARALVYPSHYEGFGLPPLEMMACGGPVLASTAGAHVELFANAAHLIPADDTDGWTAAMARVISDDDWRRQLAANVRPHAAQFTWSRCASETFAVYEKVVAGRLANAEKPGVVGG